MAGETPALPGITISKQRVDRTAPPGVKLPPITERNLSTDQQTKPLKLLVVEDSEDDAKLLLLHLRQGGYKVDSERVETAAAMKAALQRKSWDLVISDYVMPQFTGLAALRVL